MIKIQISNEAVEDLSDGFWFYEAQEAGLGDYFSSQLRADIEGLKVTAGIHKLADGGCHRLFSRKFLTRSTIHLQMTRPSFGPWWIAGEIRSGFVNIWNPDPFQA